MTWQWNSLFVPLLIGGAASFVIAIHVWRRGIILSKSGALLLIASGFWILGSAFEVLGGDLETKIFATKFQYVGICFVTPLWVIMSILLSGRERWLSSLSISILMVIPLVTFILAITNDMHGLIWKEAWLFDDNPFVLKSKGIVFNVLLVYSYLLAGLGIVITLLTVIKARRLYRWQVTAFLIVVLIPMITHAAIDNLGYSPKFEIELTPFVISIVVPAMTLGLLRWMENSIVPIARNLVVDNMKDGLIVLDFLGRIADSNPAGRNLLTKSNGEILGKPLKELNSEIAAILQDDFAQQEFDVEILVDGQMRTYNAERSILNQHQDRLMSDILVLRDITERVQAEKNIKESLDEKDALLREVHHRVKNNLQVITSLLNLQISSIENEQVISEIKESQNRISSMAFVHEQLYQSESLGQVDFKRYVRKLVNYLFDVHHRIGLDVGVDLQLEKITLDIEKAIPCGLIVNELVSNVYKHAFPNATTGNIKLRLWMEPGDIIHLFIQDDGIGFPSNFDSKNTTSLGYQLVHLLVTQLNGQIEFNGNGGTQIEIFFHHVRP